MAPFDSLTLLALVLLALSAPLAVVAGDLDILTDFVVPAPALGNVPFDVTGEYFTFRGFRAAFNVNRKSAPPHQSFNVTKATVAEFPVLNGQSVSYATLSFPPGSVNPTHTHPRASELLLVLCGALFVGFVDSANRLYTQDLGPGDMFVFPRSTVHWKRNRSSLLESS